MLPLALACHLAGVTLVGFPKEPPWQEARPDWAVDASPHEEQQAIHWLQWFYGHSDPWGPPPAPLPPGYYFTAVGQTIKIRVRGTQAFFDPYPSSIAQFTSFHALADALCHCRRQPLAVLIDRGKGDQTWVEVEGFARAEFITLATTRYRARDSRRTTPTELWPGSRGNDELGGQFGVIPGDVDFQDGYHAVGNDGLRLAERSEAPWLFSLSSLPWAYELPSVGGTYGYLKLRESLSFEDDPVRARELLQGAQKELIQAAAGQGIHVDLAFTCATSLCRVPYSVQTKYAWKTSEACKLGFPKVSDGPVVEVAGLEAFRALAREPATRRKLRAHEDRRERHGEGIPAPLAQHLVVKFKDLTPGRIYILRQCPVCKREGSTAHISEWNWRLICKRTKCAASQGMEYGEWLTGLERAARSALRAHIADDEAWRHILEHPPLVLEGPPDHQVRDHREGMLVVQREIERAHRTGRGESKSKSPSSMLLLGADCGAGKTLGAQAASRQIPIVYSGHQYTLLDAFFGHRPYQVQGLQKGCQIIGLGAPATARGVRRHYLCYPDKDHCPHLAKCPAQPRIESGNTPTCVHAAIPTVASGAVVEDSVVLSKDERGKEIGAGRHLVIDETPEFWSQSTCTGDEVRGALRLPNLVGATSLVRGVPHTEAEDAMCRLSFLQVVINRLQELMELDASKRRAEYAITWKAEQVAEVVVQVACELESDEMFVGLRSLFRVRMVADPTSFRGERECIPTQSAWTCFTGKPNRRTSEHVQKIVPLGVVDACRGIAHVLDEDADDSVEVVASLESGRVTLRILSLNKLALPGSTGTVVMTAGIALLARLVPALFPRREIRVVDVRLEHRSPTKRLMLATSSLGRSSVSRAFGPKKKSDSSSESSPAVPSPGAELSSAKKNYLGSLKRALVEASGQLAPRRMTSEIGPEPQRTLLVVFDHAAQWLLETAPGKDWLERHVPRDLEIERGDPWNQDPEKWGSIVYWGGRGKGENVWRDCRVVVTAGDNIPNLGDMEVRWGNRIDPATGEPFDPSEVAVWFSQESAMQALGRSRPGRPGLPTVLVHAGRYLPMGFTLDDDIVIAESTRQGARQCATKAKVLGALADEKFASGGRLAGGYVSRVAARAQVDPKTARKVITSGDTAVLEVLAGKSANSGICIYRLLYGQIPQLADFVAGFTERLRAALRRGSTLPKEPSARRLLERSVRDFEPPPERTLRSHLREIRKRLESDQPLVPPSRPDACARWLLALFACLLHLGLYDEFMTQALYELMPEVLRGDDEGQGDAGATDGGSDVEA